MGNLFVPNKLNYIMGKARPDVPCIFCAICERDGNVASLIVYESPFFLVSLNLYPYNPGHLLIFPKRHITDSRELTEEEYLELRSVRDLCLDVLDELYNPRGYNIGYNQGRVSGASVEHLHLHIVPRFPCELGLVDIIGGARIIVESPEETVQKLSGCFQAKA
jgi:ATP adenylyltransferase